MDLTVTWAAIIALGVFMYVVLDGFDLGIGILFPFFPEEHDRDVMMNTVAPVWDGNETWLVLGGAGAVRRVPDDLFDRAVRAVSAADVHARLPDFSRRHRSRFARRRRARNIMWDLAFIGGSAGATFFQGIVLGAFLKASRSPTAAIRATPSAGSRRSACSPASRWWSPMRCLAAAG